MASVNGAFNAVVVEAEAAGRLMFYGQGAGGAPTASAVLGDLVMAARNRVQGGRGPRESKYAKLPIAPIGFIPTRYYVNMNVADRPGVLSAVAAEFGKREVSIAEVRQEGMVDEGGQRCGARIVVVTHQATDAALSETVAALADLEVVSEHQQRPADGRNHRVRRHRRASALAGPDRGLPRPAARRGQLDADHAARRRHTAAACAPAVRIHRLHGASEGRGAQPHRVVQGSRYDDGGHRGGRPWSEGGVVRVDRQHLGIGRGVCGAGRHHLCRADTAGQDRDGQAGAGRHARRQDHPDRRQLRRLPGVGPQAHLRLPDGVTCELGQPFSYRGPEDRGFRDRRRAR